MWIWSPSAHWAFGILGIRDLAFALTWHLTSLSDMTHVMLAPVDCRRMRGVVNCSRLRRAYATLVVLVAALMPVAQAAAACTGWKASVAERMACCHSAGGHCAALSPDDCCADHESRQHAEVPVAISVPAASTSGGQLVPQQPRVRSQLVPPGTSSRPDTYLLDSVFLI
jgi:hypothetical protein